MIKPMWQTIFEGEKKKDDVWDCEGRAEEEKKEGTKVTLSVENKKKERETGSLGLIAQEEEEEKKNERNRN